MNTAKILQLADFIEKNEEIDFNIASPVIPRPSQCRTAGCIAGFAAVLWPETVGDREANTWSELGFKNETGLSTLQYSQLCFPFGMDLMKIDRQQAVWTLRNLVETGEVVYPQ